MTVQIFIPTFNRSAKVATAVASVLGQTVADIEVVVLDNHSEDDTPAVMTAIAAADSRVRYIRRERNIGMIANFNAIRALVSADFFSVLTDDDAYEPIFVETALACFSAEPRVAFVACSAPTLRGGVLVKNQLDEWREGFHRANTSSYRCLTGQYPLVTNCLFRRETAPDFVYHEDLGNVSDGMLLTCMFAKYDSCISKVVTGHWDSEGDNASTINRADPIELTNRPIREARHYREFCDRNHIAKRGLFLLWLKRFLTVLVAADKSNFRDVMARSEAGTAFSAPARILLRGFHQLRIVRLVLWALAVSRSFRRRWVVWREA
jgi:glycosyltransferase involved in cell wall biosynthesis